jgi:hypothetical protein
MKKCSTSLVVKEMQINTTLRFHFTLVGMVTIKNTTTNIGENVGRKEPTYTACGNANEYNQYGEQKKGSSRN